MATETSRLRLLPYRSDMFVIHGRVGGIDHKLFQIVYRNQDGAIFVNLANYFAHTQGIAAHVLVPASGGVPVQVDLAGDPQGARLTTSLVKYSHHYNGYAHFSQSGKLDPEKQIHKDAQPLSQVRGHLFTLHVKGFRDFRTAAIDFEHLPDASLKKRTPIVFHFPEGDPGEVKFVGGWAPARAVLHEYAWAARNGAVPPIIVEKLTGDHSVQRVMLAPPLGTPSADSVLVLRCAPVPYASQEPDSHLVLIGGFDPPAVVLHPERDTTMLALKFPATRWEDLQVAIASMDLRQDEPSTERSG